MEKHDDFSSKKRRIECDITEDIPNFKGEGSSKVIIQSASTITYFVDTIVYKLYFKGLVSNEMVEDGREQFKKAGFGVAICDEMDNLLYEIKEQLNDGVIDRKEVEMVALARGLNESFNLGIKNIMICCDDHEIYQTIIGRWKPNEYISDLVEEVNHLRRKMASSEPVLIARNDVKFAFTLAREAMDSQSSIDVNATSGEICAICFEETEANRIFIIEKCFHRFCISCVRQHLEVKLLDGVVPKCLQFGCESELNFESCTEGKILTTKLKEMWTQKMKENSIPTADKIYCPYPNCATLMSKSELPGGSDQTNVRACIKCCGLFCIDCKVQAHSDLSCADYKKLYSKSEDDEVMFKSLADDNGWRQCIKCMHYIDRFEGCNHMTCRCGYQFCYECGREWKDESCPSGCRLIGHGNVDDSDYNDDSDSDSDDDDDYYSSDSDDDDDSGDISRCICDS